MTGSYPATSEGSESPQSENFEIESKLVKAPKATRPASPGIQQRKSTSTPSTSKGSAAKRTRKKSAADAVQETLPLQRQGSPSAPRRRNKPSPSVKRDPPVIVTVLKSLMDLLLYPLQLVLSSAASIITLVGCFAVLLAFLYYTVSSPFANMMSPLYALPRAISNYPTVVYCDLIGIGCGSQPRKKKPTVAALARTVTEQATQAHDIFQSISAMGDPSHLGLHHTELWELAVAVSASSQLPGRYELSGSLKELGDLTRDVKDRLVTINSIGINSFSWTVQEFKRIETTIKHIYAKTGPYTSADISRQLDILFERLSGNLETLLTQIEGTIPKADRASLLGGTVLEDFAREQRTLLIEKEDTPLWRQLMDKSSYKGKQLGRDLELAEVSIGNLKTARSDLEEARRFLLQYRDNVAYFKAGVIGFHMADHMLSPEHEVEALQNVMAQFSGAVDSAKKGEGPRRRKEIGSA